ncbi:DUF2306 domain-containing protein [Bradyrhizobium yuanmingense]|uniref:DUF2306 domain-containing protein n=1 Tax=Bradyrhizobium yuanmingense TaxID=108015 RepID=UPI001CD19A08|nr:DUF2306 domain-containing protein [Bradyrhizobium yuanmingense]MCA1525926.1 DUF2306 domain-containing protein [Bradyrhizobium yuanmingense]
MIAHLTPAGAIHVVLALMCLVAGLIQFLRPKRGAAHRARGYFYVYAMLASDAASLLVYRFTGHFNAFHVAAIVNFTLIVLAIVPLLRTPRPANWRRTHYNFIAWSYVAPVSAAITNIASRLLPVTTREQVALIALAASLLTMMVAYILIRKHQPPADAPAMSTGLVERSGAPS